MGNDDNVSSPFTRNRTLLQATYMLTTVKLHTETNSIKASAERELEVPVNVLDYASHDQRHVIAQEGNKRPL